MNFIDIKIPQHFSPIFWPAWNLHRLHGWRCHWKTQCAIACRSATVWCQLDCKIIYMYSIFIRFELHTWYHYIKTASGVKNHYINRNPIGYTIFLFSPSLLKPCLLERNGPKPIHWPWLQPGRASWSLFWSLFTNEKAAAKKVPHLVLISFFRFRHFFIMRDLVFIMSDLVYKISNVLNLPRFGSPPFSFWPHFAGGQHFHKPCLTPHVVVFIVNKCSSSHGFQSLSGGRRHGR